MVRRSPGTESAAGFRGARARLAATLGGDAEAAGAFDPGVSGAAGNGDYAGEPAAAVVAAAEAVRARSHSSGLLDVPVGTPTLAPGLRDPSLDTAAGRGDEGRRVRDATDYSGAPHGRWPQERLPLSAWLRTRTGVGAGVLLGVLAAVLGGFFWWQAATGGVEAVPLGEASTAAEEASAPAPEDSGAPQGEEAGAGRGSITVHVAGAVARPGVVQLPAGSRLYEAITAAGGAAATADPDRLNLAAVLEDGQKVLVPVLGEPDQAGSSAGGTEHAAPGPGGGGTDGTGGTSPGGGKVNLNTADVEELGTLPRVGPVLAQRIVEWRQQHGRFKSVQELDAVDGIGPKLLDALLPLVGV